MTEMVYGAIPRRDGDPILPRWWRTIDRWSISCILILFGIGLLLGLAASPPLAARNGLPSFHYVERQLLFGAVALVTMFATTMMSPTLVRRLGVIGFGFAFIAVVMLPVLGTDFSKGAVRWYSLGFASVQPSEFLKPGFIIVAAWLMAASHELNGPPGKAMSLGLLIVISAFLVTQPDYGQTALIAFGCDVFSGGCPNYRVGHPCWAGLHGDDRGL